MRCLLISASRFLPDKLRDRGLKDLTSIWTGMCNMGGLVDEIQRWTREQWHSDTVKKQVSTSTSNGRDGGLVASGESLTFCAHLLAVSWAVIKQKSHFVRLKYKCVLHGRLNYHICFTNGKSLHGCQGCERGNCSFMENGGLSLHWWDVSNGYSGWIVEYHIHNQTFITHVIVFVVG